MTNFGSRSSIVVDCTHLSRRASGIERITRDLFSPQALAPLPVEWVESPGNRLSMVLHQSLSIPAKALRNPRAVWVFPGYPPSPAFLATRQRTALYVHDLFLISRKQDLNAAAKVYMALPFRLAIRRLRYFFVNSLATGKQLQPSVQEDAVIIPYRPRAANIFGVTPKTMRASSLSATHAGGALIIGTLGTVEPRKNLLAGARICMALAQRLGRPVEFHIVGRRGWGDDYDELSRLPHVHLHGFLGDDEVRDVIERFDAFLCTSHDEGLGLPLLEVQHAGIPIIAPDNDVFREVLGESGIYINASGTQAATARIAALFEDAGQRDDWTAKARHNLERWNAQADLDRSAAVALLEELAKRANGATA
jgi:glycosyltransferase involved in cell wall biosynthesis